MTIDRKRLRELALGEHDNEACAKFIAAANPQTILELLDALDAAEQPTERSEDARNNEREACARIAESKFARIHTFASENSDRYIAMRDAGDAIADEIRHRAAAQAKERT